MPIQLNFLAEAQAAEDLRRRDPVKRAAWLGAALVGLMFTWSGTLQLRALLASGEVSRLEAQMNSQSNEFHQVLENQSKAAEIHHKLASLHQLATNRFLQGSMLNALQHTPVEDVQLVHFKTEQSYAQIEETKARTNSDRVIPAKPAMVTEKIAVILDGNDSSGSPGDEVGRYKESISTNAFFRKLLGQNNGVNLRNLSLPQVGNSGKPFVLFTLDCRLPERTR
jgi:hypothetical protein